MVVNAFQVRESQANAMTQIDFYLPKANAQLDRHLLACKLVDKAWAAGHRVLIYCETLAECQQLDGLLWSFRPESFIPHGLMHQVDPTCHPVLLSHHEDPDEEQDVLINLGNGLLPFFSRFQRLLEPLDHRPDILEKGRARFRYYRERGYPLKHHELAQ